jgi:hypothetical protein
VRAAAKRSKDGPQARRLLALAAIYEGTMRSEAAKIGGVTLQIVRDWVVKFNPRGPEGLIDRKAPGQPARLNDTHRAALAEIIDAGGARRRALAADRSLPMDFRRVPAHDRAHPKLCSTFPEKTRGIAKLDQGEMRSSYGPTFSLRATT